MKKKLSILSLCLLLFSCEEQFGNSQNELNQETLDYSVELFPGEIVDQTSVVLDDINLWKVTIQNPTGALVSFYWQKGLKALYRAEGELGPFDYNINPPGNLLSLSTARFLAYESYEEKTLQRWNLYRNRSTGDRWTYEFYVQEQENPIVIDAISGEFM